MHNNGLQPWQHDHAFGQDIKRPGEIRTIVVIALTAVMMVVEILAGMLFGSMALLADGLHMASHAAALSISALAYIYARRHAHDERFSFGTGKVNALGGFASAVLLAAFALVMAWESVQRFIDPVDIAFNQAILVAVVGLLVNGASVFILGHEHQHDHDPHEDHDHHEDHGHETHADTADHHDHNLRAAYLHVLADALTSLLAIVALLAGKYWGWIWMDPLMGVVGSLLVARWSVGLLRTTSAVLLDRQAQASVRDAIRARFEDHADSRISDLHVWSIGPNIYAVELALVASQPRRPDHYKAMLPGGLGLAHVSIEVHADRAAGRDRVEENGMDSA